MDIHEVERCIAKSDIARSLSNSRKVFIFANYQHIKGPFDLRIQLVYSPFPNKPLFLRVCRTSLLKA